MENLCQRLIDAAIANWPLVVLGIPGIWAAVWTLKAIRKQTDAMINSERAWVMVDLEKVLEMGGVLEGTHKDKSGITTHDTGAFVRCICSNHGQTPARITEKRCRLVVVDSANALPKTPDLNIEIMDPVPHYLGAGKDPAVRDWTVTGEGTEFPGNMVVIYGVVRYKHIFSEKEAQTTFGYRLTPDHKFERLTDYPKYNENT